MRLPLWLKLAWTLWIAVWVPVYWRQYGPENFLWFCDFGNLVVAIALWTESRLLFSMEAVGLIVFQALYTVDIIGALCTSRHWIGGTEYMFDPHLPLVIRLLSLFHLAMPPLLLWVLWRIGYDRRGWIAQTLFTWVVILICNLWHPERDVNWVRGWAFHDQHAIPTLAYVLVYALVVPAVVYYPTHLVLSCWFSRRER